MPVVKEYKFKQGTISHSITFGELYHEDSRTGIITRKYLGELQMDNENKLFFDELKQYSELGVRILLEDSVSTPQEIYQTCMMCEDMPYMCDFIFREDEKLSELHFRKVKKKK